MKSGLQSSWFSFRLPRLKSCLKDFMKAGCHEGCQACWNDGLGAFSGAGDVGEWVVDTNRVNDGMPSGRNERKKSGFLS
jgi:hypothetical protein